MLSLPIKTAYDVSHSVCLVRFPQGFQKPRPEWPYASFTIKVNLCLVVFLSV